MVQPEFPRPPNAEDPPAIQIDRVCYDLRIGFWMRQRRLIDHLSLEVAEGGLFGFLGANGAGKTTLIHLICGIKRPSIGEVRIFGVSSSERAGRERLGYLPERPYFYEHLTGDQLLSYFGRLSGMPESRIKERIPEVLAAVKLTRARHEVLRGYSKGMLQRIGIAQAILHDPRLLVLDEPMSGLDPLGRREIRDLLLKMAADKKTIFFSTHVVSDAEMLCERVALIKKGRLLASGRLKDLLRDEKSFSRKSVNDSGAGSLENWFDQEDEGQEGSVE